MNSMETGKGAGRRIKLLLTGLLGVAAVAIVVWVALASPAAEREEPQGIDHVAIDDIYLVSAEGQSEPLLPGKSGYTIVVSTGCAHCHVTLQRISQMAEGEELPGLRVVTVEGAAKGQEFLDSVGLVGASSLEPQDLESLAMAVGLTAVPLLLEFDEQGIVRSQIGGLSEEEISEMLPALRN